MPPSTLPSRLVSRNIYLAGKRTSIRLEPELWDALQMICEQQQVSLHQLCTHIAEENGSAPFTSAVRVFTLRHFVARHTLERVSC